MGSDGQVTQRAVFLDRDGVINRTFLREGTWSPPSSVAELEILPGVSAALNALRAKGYVLVVVTNQPDVARGTLSQHVVEALHERLRSELPLDAIFACFHDSDDRCDCRKPKPGLLLQAARALGIDLSRSFMVGDRWSDVEAGKRAGCRTLFVGTHHAEPTLTSCDFRVGSLTEAADIIIRES